LLPSSPTALVAAFHAGMFSFWGTVALAPRIVLDRRLQVAKLRHRFLTTFTVLGVVAYLLTFLAKIAAAEKGVQFLATIGPVVVTFLAMNMFYVQDIACCRQSPVEGPRLPTEEG
jgi:hypothetical protein